MTKYIDRYYLNGELYGIKFANPSKTFTVTFTETSDPTQFNPVYSDDAAGLTAGSTDFDEFFGYSAVRLNGSGVETAEITQTDSGGNGKLDVTQLGTLTSGDNVMIKFPVRGIKMTKNGSTITLSITDGIGRESEGYQYYAFQKTGDIEYNASTTVATTPFYMGTYLAYTSGSTLKSWSGQSPQGNYTIGNAISYAGNNGSGYTIFGFYQREYINALYMMKYGNPNSQSVIGYGASGGTGATNGLTDATGNSSNRVRLFGIEDWRGNKWTWVGGIFTDESKNVWTALHSFTGSTSTSQSQYKNTGTALYSSSGNGSISSVVGNNKGMFTPLSYSNDYSTYWCDYVTTGANGILRDNGNGGDLCGAFTFYNGDGTSTADSSITTRIMYL